MATHLSFLSKHASLMYAEYRLFSLVQLILPGLDYSLVLQLVTFRSLTFMHVTRAREGKGSQTPVMKRAFTIVSESGVCDVTDAVLPFPAWHPPTPIFPMRPAPYTFKKNINGFSSENQLFFL